LPVLEKADEEVIRWAQSVLPGVEVALGPPLAEADAPAVSLHLLALTDIPAARGAGRVSPQFGARYLVTSAAADPAEAHRLLGALLFAALEQHEFEVGFADVPDALWAAAGALPRAAFSLFVRVRRVREDEPTPRVRGPIVVRGAPLAPLEGLVLGPGDVPISDAFIALPKLSATTRSDRRGRFRFAAVPSDVPTALVVRAKAGEFPFTVASPPESEPVVLRLALNEG
jgi:hypothetical protein